MSYNIVGLDVLAFCSSVTTPAGIPPPSPLEIAAAVENQVITPVIDLQAVINYSITQGPITATDLTDAFSQAREIVDDALTAPQNIIAKPAVAVTLDGS